MIQPRATRVRQLIASVIVLCHVVAAMPPVFAAASTASAEPLSIRPIRTPNGVISGAPSADDIAQMRSIVAKLQASRDAGLKAQGARLATWLEILTAPTPGQRHSAIQRLPVTVLQSVATDGREGVVKTFVAGGKPRRHLFVAAAPAASADDETRAPGRGGPREDGPGQEVCYFEGHPDACVTQQELEDLSMIVAAAAAEVDVMQAEYDASYAEYQAYCSENPWDCEGEMPSSGPSACAGASCASQAVYAVTSIATAGATTYLVGEGIVAGTIATTGAVLASSALVGAAVIVAGWTAWEWYKCMRPRATQALVVSLLPVAEPV